MHTASISAAHPPIEPHRASLNVARPPPPVSLEETAVPFSGLGLPADFTRFTHRRGFAWFSRWQFDEFGHCSYVSWMVERSRAAADGADGAVVSGRRGLVADDVIPAMRGQ